jgi:diadenosine tetraphosphate (Ap4A) HIT family hydrolase
MVPDPAAAGWSLDPQLERDTVEVGDLPLSQVRLINDANYPWMLLVPRRRGIVEIVELDEIEQSQLMGEIMQASRALKVVSACDKINIAALGNVVSQLHVHVIARSRGDAAWPKPVWGAVPPRDYDSRTLDQLLGLLRQRLPLA